jgi:uncharacterized protein YabE (DUF348 family)
MKQILIAILSTSIIACNLNADPTVVKKDSIDSVTVETIDKIDSAAQAQIKKVDSIAQVEKQQLDKEKNSKKDTSTNK